MAERTCEFEEQTTFAEYPSLWSPRIDSIAAPPPPSAGHQVGRSGGTMGRRGFLQRAAVATGALTAADFLRYFIRRTGCPNKCAALLAVAEAGR